MGTRRASVTNLFLRQLASDMKLPPETVRILHASGARTPEAIQSLLENFPTLTTRGHLEARPLSNAVVQRGGLGLQTIMKMSAARERAPQSRRAPGQRGYGASPPPKTRWQVNVAVEWQRGLARSIDEALKAPTGAAPVQSPKLDFRGCPPWPVRDQGQRGTCVAFGTTALREQLMCEQDRRLDDLSEQFLYWDIKTNSSDPQKTIDGTWIEFAFESLGKTGICGETTWPYNPVSNPGNVGQGGAGIPPPPTIAGARPLRYTAAIHQKPTITSGNAQLVLDALSKNHRPVAVALPVFADPAASQSNNWETNVGWFYGLVLDPPAEATVTGGHCVCVTGFAPDESEPLGGYFIIRNSWHTQWGSQLPAAGYHGPEPGYGQISASYVDQYLWEFGQL
jgi:hypothetical protein